MLKINGKNISQVVVNKGTTPSGTIEIGENGSYDVSSYASANVNVESSGGNTLKNLLDNTKSAYYLFDGYLGDNLSDLIQYNDTENVENFRNMFSYCSKATTFPQIDTSNGTNFGYMYQICSSATSFPTIDTSNGTNFGYMYGSCSKATSFPTIDTSKGTNFSYMYQNCSSATTSPLIDTSNGTDFRYMYANNYKTTYIPKLDTLKGTNFNSMFMSCYEIKKLDISHYNISTTNNTSQWCSNCYNLKALIIRSFGANYVLNSNAFNYCCRILGIKFNNYNQDALQDGYIYIPRDMISILNNETNWSTVATQFRALEDYTKDGTCQGEFDDVKAGL